ncbi:MAG: DUF4360 domain-containing protein [Oligoflexales bacterium]
MLRHQYFAGLLLLAFSVRAAAQDGPSGVTIDSLEYQGSGCVDGTVGQDIAPDLGAFTLIFDNFLVDRMGADSRCRIDLRINVPVGWQFKIFSVQVRGYVNLDAGAKGRQELRIHATGTPVDVKKELQGPRDEDYILSESLSNAKWSQCQNRSHKIRVEARASLNGPASASGLLTVDSIDGVVTQKYGMAWQRCTGNGNGGGGGHGNGGGNGHGNGGGNGHGDGRGQNRG